MYFDKKRALAFGIGTMGTPLGGMLLPVLLTNALAAYGLEGALLIEAGLCLHLVVCGALLRPVMIRQSGDPDGKGKATRDDDLCDNETRTNIVFSDAISISSLDDVTSRSLYSLPSPIAKRRQVSPHKAVLMKSLAGNGELKSGANGTTFPMLNEQLNPYKSEAPDVNKNLMKANQVKQNCVEDMLSETVGEECEKTFLKKASTTFQPYLHLLKEWRFMIYCVVGFLDFFVRCVPTWFSVVHAETLGMSNKVGASLLIIFAVTDGSVKLVVGMCSYVWLRMCSWL